MKLVRFLTASYIRGRFCEAGSEHWIDDDVPLHAHHYDVSAEKHGELPPPGDIVENAPQFIDHSGDTMVDSLHSTGYSPAHAERAKG